MPKLKFLRRNWSKASRLGKGRKKKQVWRSAKGRHSKMRNKRKGYPAIVEIGFRTDKKTRGLIQEKAPVRIMNLKEMEKMNKGELIIIGSVGMKKKVEMIKKAKEKGLVIANVHTGKTLKMAEKKKAKKTKSSEQVQASSVKNAGREDKK
jgi:large subunit ribosomal protein L32e